MMQHPGENLYLSDVKWLLKPAVAAVGTMLREAAVNGLANLGADLISGRHRILAKAGETLLANTVGLLFCSNIPIEGYIGSQRDYQFRVEVTEENYKIALANFDATKDGCLIDTIVRLDLDENGVRMIMFDEHGNRI